MNFALEIGVYKHGDPLKRGGDTLVVIGVRPDA